MAEQNYEPIAPVNTNINGDDANKFAVKYKKEIENIYKLLRGIIQGNGGVVVDEALSATSPNPVENRAITARLNNMYTKAEITQMLAALSGGGSGGAYGEANSYKVTITQSEHQSITVRKYLAASSTLYTATFTAAEVFWNLEIKVEADEGYIAGDLIVNGVHMSSPAVISLDKDYTIYATEATVESQQGWRTVYINGAKSYFYGQWDYCLAIASNKECTNWIDKAGLSGKVIIVDVNGYIDSFRRTLGSSNTGVSSAAFGVTAVRTNMRTGEAANFTEAFYGLRSLREITCTGWDMSNATDCSSMFNGCGGLQSLNIANWNVKNLVYAGSMFAGCGGLESLDLSGWCTEKLRSAGDMFASCTGIVALDISGWKTENIESLTMPPAVKYIIMDDDTEIKFSGHYIFSNPNNYVKYLVPTNMVSLYKNHANWSGRYSQIDDIAKYTITRHSGKVDVTLNV